MNRTRFYHGWWVLLVAGGAHGFTTGTLTYSYSVIASPISTELNTPRMQIMLGMTLYMFIAAIIAPLAGRLLDHWQTRWFMTLGALCLAAGMFALSGTHSLWMFFVIFALLMAPAKIILGPMCSTALASRWFSRLRGRAMGLVALGTSIGGLLLPPLIQGLIDGLGWRSAFVVYAGITLVVILPPVLWIIHNRPQDVELQPDGDSAFSAPPPASSAMGDVGLKQLARLPAFWSIAIAAGSMIVVYNALLSNMMPLLTDMAFTPARAAQLISLLSLAGIVGKLCFGYLADVLPLKIAMWCAQALLIVSMLTLAQEPPPSLLTLTVIAIGFAAGGLLPVWGGLVAAVFGTVHYGGVMGAMSTVTMLMSMVAPPLTGLAYDSTGSYSIAFNACALLLLAGALLLVGLRVPHGDR